MLVVEDGTGLSTANAYVSLDECIEYCALRGLTFGISPSGDSDAAIIRATEAIDAKYRGRFPGYRVNGREQSLEWPRISAYDYEGNLIAADEVPQEIKDATCEAAVREFATAGSMMPDLGRGGAIRRLKADTVEIEYADNALVATTFTLIDGILAGILITGSGGGLFGVTVRS